MAAPAAAAPQAAALGGTEEVGAAAAGNSREGEGGQAEDVRTILKRKEEEVKEMLAPEKDMYGESFLVVWDFQHKASLGRPPLG